MLCRKPFAKRRTGIIHPIKVKGSGDYLRDITPFACGQCLHCRINQSRVWQTRLILEASDTLDSTFMTLTYDEDHVPWNYYLEPEHLTKFLKRYRKRLGHKIRYFAVGEYGDKKHFWRPHYHLAVFSEKRLERCIRPCEDMRKRGHCTQDCIARLSWPKGNISVTEKLTPHLAGYLTGYITAKATKDRRINRPNEFQRQSTGRHADGHGGIGYRAVKKIADRFRDYPGNSKQIISSLNFGGRSRPLGQYLQKHLSTELGIDQRLLDDSFIEYAVQQYAKYSKDGMIIPELLRQNQGGRDSQRVRHTNFKRRTSL